MFRTCSFRLLIMVKNQSKAGNTRQMSCKLYDSSDHAKFYAQFRPDYPESVVKAIVDYYTLASTDLSTAVDVGCGSGQSTYPLSKHFKKVIGLDVSEKQIEQAKNKFNNIEFREGPAEDLSFLDTCSVNVITTAQSIHWFNHEVFYKEVDRVLFPGGVLAAYGYGMAKENKKRAQELVWQFFSQYLSDTSHWCKVEEVYRTLQFPYNDKIINNNLEIVKRWTVDQYVGYISSWSSWQQYTRNNPSSSALQTLHEKLLGLYPDEELITIQWPIYMVLGTKPKA